MFDKDAELDVDLVIRKDFNPLYKPCDDHMLCLNGSFVITVCPGEKFIYLALSFFLSVFLFLQASPGILYLCVWIDFLNVRKTVDRTQCSAFKKLIFQKILQECLHCGKNCKEWNLPLREILK